jgi:hypothetical protein
VQQLLKLSVWADLRDGGERAHLLISVAPRLGFCRVVVPTTGPLAGAQGLAAHIVANTPTSIQLDTADMAVSAPDGRRHDGRISSWPGRDLSDLLRATARPPTAPGLVLDVPVSVGRTQTEAAARAASDPVFAATGTPQGTGLYGRLEDVQAQVAVLAAAGVGELCCILPAEDLLDHLAQLATVAVGHPDTHAPGLARSPDPPPPAGWGAPLDPSP